jgi:hypothetical protein
MSWGAATFWARYVRIAAAASRSRNSPPRTACREFVYAVSRVLM